MLTIISYRGERERERLGCEGLNQEKGLIAFMIELRAAQLSLSLSIFDNENQAIRWNFVLD